MVGSRLIIWLKSNYSFSVLKYNFILLVTFLKFAGFEHLDTLPCVETKTHKVGIIWTDGDDNSTDVVWLPLVDKHFVSALI